MEQTELKEILKRRGALNILKGNNRITQEIILLVN
jgi:hypothetical protein